MSIQDKLSPVNPEDLKQLKERMNLIANADPNQYHNDFSLKRYLRAFTSVDNSFQVNDHNIFPWEWIILIAFFFINNQAILKTNKWREEYGVKTLSELPAIDKHANKARVLRHRDCTGRPVIYIPAKNHNAADRDINELTQFIVYCLEQACTKCFEEVTDNLCIVFDLAEFSTSSMDYQLIKNLIWLLSKHYPERMGACVIMNSPTIFSTIFPVIKGW